MIGREETVVEGLETTSSGDDGLKHPKETDTLPEAEVK